MEGAAKTRAVQLRGGKFDRRAVDTSALIVEFDIPDGLVDEVEIVGLHYTREDDDSIYTMSFKGDGMNGGALFEKEEDDKTTDDVLLSGSSSGCDAGVAGVMTMAVATLLAADKIRRRGGNKRDRGQGAS